MWDCFKLVKEYPLCGALSKNKSFSSLQHCWTWITSGRVCWAPLLDHQESADCTPWCGLRGRHMCPLFVSPPTNKGCAFISTTSAALNLSAKTHGTIIFMWVCCYRGSPTAFIVSPLPRGHRGPRCPKGCLVESWFGSTNLIKMAFSKAYIVAANLLRRVHFLVCLSVVKRVVVV